MGSKFPCLMYHEIEREGRPLCSSEPGYIRYVVTERAFRQQLEWLSSVGIRGDAVSGVLTKPPQQRSVIVTFDDGSASDLDIAAPELLRRGFGATFFVTTGFLGRAGHLTTSQVRELCDLGFEIGSHGVTHRYLTDLSPAEARSELVDSRSALEDITGRSIQHVSAPGGRWNTRIARLAREAGFITLATSDIGLNDLTATTLRRLAVTRPTSLAQFRDMCLGHHLTGAILRSTGLRVVKRLVGNARYESMRTRLLGSAGD